MKIAMASDHGGFGLKEDLRAWLTEQGHQVVDCGCYGTESCDYPEFGRPPPARWPPENVSGASWYAPPVSASPFPPTR